jgi:DNA polymerase III delta prime subunit
MEGELLLEKYKPLTIDQFLGSKDCIDVLRNFLTNDHNQSNASSLMILGPSGCGKTTLCELLFKQYNYYVIRPVYDHFDSHKAFETFIQNALFSKSVMDMMGAKKKVLFLDDIDILLSQDRYANVFLIELLDKVKSRVKIVFTASQSEEKRLSDLKKKAIITRLSPPPYNDVAHFVKSVLLREGYQFADEDVDELVQAMSGNVRNIMLNLTSYISNEENAAIYQYFDKNIYGIVACLMLNAHRGLKDLDVALSSDPSLISNILYDNYRGVAREISSVHSIPYTFSKQIGDMYVYGSILEEYAFGNMDWGIIELANYLRCGAIRIDMHRLFRSYIKETPYTYQYTQIGTRSAQHYNNNKQLSKYMKLNGLSKSNFTVLGDVLAVMDRKASQKSRRLNKDVAPALNAYINNICTVSPSPFAYKVMYRGKNNFFDYV